MGFDWKFWKSTPEEITQAGADIEALSSEDFEKIRESREAASEEESLREIERKAKREEAEIMASGRLTEREKFEEEQIRLAASDKEKQLREQRESDRLAKLEERAQTAEDRRVVAEERRARAAELEAKIKRGTASRAEADWWMKKGKTLMAGSPTKKSMAPYLPKPQPALGGARPAGSPFDYGKLREAGKLPTIRPTGTGTSRLASLKTMSIGPMGGMSPIAQAATGGRSIMNPGIQMQKPIAEFPKGWLGGERAENIQVFRTPGAYLARGTDDRAQLVETPLKAKTEQAMFMEVQRKGK